VGISNYNAEQTEIGVNVLKSLGTPCIIHQPKYSMFERTPEKGLLDVLEKNGVGCIPFSPLAQGMLTDRYLKGIPADSRAAKEHGFLKTNEITTDKLVKIKKLNELAEKRGQSLSQMAIAWLMKKPVITSVLIGVSSVEQLEANLGTLDNTIFNEQELAGIEKILA
jgi:L-glyceraldehyde 3-phosphate reductase